MSDQTHSLSPEAASPGGDPSPSEGINSPEDHRSYAEVKRWTASDRSSVVRPLTPLSRSSGSSGEPYPEDLRAYSEPTSSAEPEASQESAPSKKPESSQEPDPSEDPGSPREPRPSQERMTGEPAAPLSESAVPKTATPKPDTPFRTARRAELEAEKAAAARSLRETEMLVEAYENAIMDGRLAIQRLSQTKADLEEDVAQRQRQIVGERMKCFHLVLTVGSLADEIKELMEAEGDDEGQGND